MKVAIIGGGISGLMAAEQLNGLVDYSLYEQADYLGGHANTHSVLVDDQVVNVDTGFIVFNQDVYQHFNDLLTRYQVESIQSDMSFAVSNRVTGLEYNATNLNRLFCQRRNIFNPRFYRMIWDIRRFYQQANEIIGTNTECSLFEYLEQNNYSKYFIEEHIIPMVSALWSGDFESVKDYPLIYMLKFMKNHQMLQLNQRPEWRTIKGGSQAYVQAVSSKLIGEIKLNHPIIKVKREHGKFMVISDQDQNIYDQVVFATHSDITSQIIDDEFQEIKDVMSKIAYVENHMDLHVDETLLPRNKKAWASWSVNKHAKIKPVCTVNYYMNLLQSLPCETPVIVSLNQNEYIDSCKILLSKKYHHPVYTHNTLRAQKVINNLQGKSGLYFCGAYQGWGFHEDGARSGFEVANLIKQSLQI